MKKAFARPWPRSTRSTPSSKVVSATKEYLAGPFTYADIAFYMAQFFAGFLGKPIPATLTGLQAWRRRVGARESVAAVAGKMSDYLTSNGVRVPAAA